MTAQDRLSVAANRNAEILEGLSKTEHAPSALKQSQAYLNDLDHEIRESEAILKRLASKTQQEKKDHDKYQESTMRRFAYRATGKRDRFQEKASKEEREYFDAMNAEQQANSRLREWTRSRDMAAKEHSELEKTAKQHHDLQAELDALYDSIFAGPSPEFPGEDGKEGACSQAKEQFNIAKQRQTAESQAVQCLVDADAFMTRALGDLDAARDYSRADMFGGGTFSDMMERDALSRAQNGTDKVKMLVAQAQRLSPEIRALGPMDIAQGHILSDVVFDNIFSDMRMHDEIKACQAQCVNEAKNLKRVVSEAKKREAELKGQVSQAFGNLEGARRDLQQIRQEFFKTAAQLPSYHK